MSRWIAVVAVAVLCIATWGGVVNAAGPVREYEAAFEGVYGDYRAALFATNGKDAALSMKAINAFGAKWEALAARWGAAPPPQYADDPAWHGLMKSAQGIVERARAAVRDGDLPKAHDILEAFRDEIGSLHARNNVATFSDRMNAYHAVMEGVLGKSYVAGDEPARQALAGDAAVLAYLASDLERHAPTSLRDNGEFKSLLSAVRASVAGLRKALSAADVDAVRAAVSGLKPAYSRFFLKFG